MLDAVLKQAAHDRSAVLNSTFQIIAQYPKIPVKRMEFDDFVLIFKSPYKINIRQENEYFIMKTRSLI